MCEFEIKYLDMTNQVHEGKKIKYIVDILDNVKNFFLNLINVHTESLFKKKIKFICLLVTIISSISEEHWIDLKVSDAIVLKLSWLICLYSS